MKPNDRARLTTALRDHVGKIAADLRAKMRAPGETRVRAQQLHADEKVAEDFDVWTDLLSRRAAVLWVLKSVYVRVLEDRGLLTPGRLLDQEAQQLFERLAPHLGETAFLRWVYRDLASSHGGLPELFSPQPAEVALPSDELSRALIAFWRHRDADTGATWSFAEERFEGELMGDLYQELDPVVKDRFALCQTPDFVRAFILDRTLTPAIETFGAEEVRLLDPACGSGHFLIDGLKRLVAATEAKHADWERGKLVAHALERVVGVDLNDYACALARARLIMTAAELAGVTKLADAARFHPHVYWADGLEQVEREEQKPSLQYALFEKVEEKPRATLTRSDVRAALRKVFAARFHAVVANPPYIVESDEARKAYHKEKLGRLPRYLSAHRQYSLGAPFTERCLQLCEPNGFVGIITSNNFMKREFGKPLIEKVLAALDLTLVVDTSHAAVLQRDTTTVLLFARNRKPTAEAIRTVMGKRGETTAPENAAKGLVWASILEGWGTVGFDNEFVSVADLPRKTLSKHPWSLGGGGASGLKTRLELAAESTLDSFVESVGFASFAGLDEPFYQPTGVFRRMGYEPKYIRPLLTGQSVRDWSLRSEKEALTPYDPEDATPIGFAGAFARLPHLWRFRTSLNGVRSFSGDRESEGAQWWSWYRWIPERYRVRQRITYAAVATHNHFAVERGGAVFNNKAPIIILKNPSDDGLHAWLLGVLNSSTTAFWMRQTFQVKGGQSTGKKRQSETWSRRLEYDGTKLRRAPVVSKLRGRIEAIAGTLVQLAREAALCEPRVLLNGDWRPADIEKAINDARSRLGAIRRSMIAWQEELDWAVYQAFGLVDESVAGCPEAPEPIASEHRPFAIRLGARCARGEGGTHWFEALGLTPSDDIPANYSPDTQDRIRRRIEAIDGDEALALIESPECKRKWEWPSFDGDLASATFDWFASAIERALELRKKPLAGSHIAAVIQDDERFIALASVHQKRRDVDLGGLVEEVLGAQSVPEQPLHIYTESGLLKRSAWEAAWALQRRQDAGEAVAAGPVPPEYSQGSRGKAIDFLRAEYWHLRGRLDVPRERFITFTHVPGRAGAEMLYGWAGWTAHQRVRAILAIDEELEDAAVPLADRIGLLDSAWRLLPDVAREDAAAATRLKAELQALVGPEGPSRELIEDWKKRFPPPTTRATRTKRAAAARVEDDSEDEESDES